MMVECFDSEMYVCITDICEFLTSKDLNEVW